MLRFLNFQLDWILLLWQLMAINPITNVRHFEIRQLRGGLFGPDPENKVNVNWLIWTLVIVVVCRKLVNVQNFKLFAFLLLEIWRHKKILSRRELVIAIRFCPPNQAKFEKNHCLCLKTSFSTQHYDPLHFPGFQVKQKIHMFNFRNRSFHKQLQQPLWWIDFVKILPKCD